MTNYERHLFSELVDVNYEIETGNHKPIVRMALITRYSQIVRSLEDSMGVKEYRDYIDGMRRMFAPVGGYGMRAPRKWSVCTLRFNKMWPGKTRPLSLSKQN